MSLIELTALQWAAAIGSALIVGLTKAGFGAGAGILAVPLMVVALEGSENMLPVMLPVLICGDIFSIIHYPKRKHWPSLRMLIPGCVAGVVVGSVVLVLLGAGQKSAAELGKSTGKLSGVLDPLIGAVCLFFLVVQLWRFFRESSLSERAEPYRPRPWHGYLVGIWAGAISTLAHAAGQLVALFLLPQKLEKRVYVGTAVTYFAVGNAVKVVPYAFMGLFTWQRFGTSLVLMPAAIVGTLLGLVLQRRFSGRAFTLFIYACTLAMAIKLLWKVFA